MVSADFITAGRAVFTVSNPAGERYTFRVKMQKSSSRFREAYFVSLLTGPDNTADFTYLGVLDSQSGKVFPTKASGYRSGSKPVLVLSWALRLIWNNQSLPEGYAIRHEGRCGRCGRALTVPESIDCGIGPECIKAVGNKKQTGKVPA